MGAASCTGGTEAAADGPDCGALVEKAREENVDVGADVDVDVSPPKFCTGALQVWRAEATARSALGAAGNIRRTGSAILRLVAKSTGR